VLQSAIVGDDMSRLSNLLPICLMLLSPFCRSHAQQEPTRPNLRKFSSDQLKACFDDFTICRADDIWEISEELVRRLPKLPTEKLVACFDDWRICGSGEDRANGWPVSDELARRGNPHELLVRYWNEPKWTIRGGIEHVAYHFDNPEVTAFMRRVLAQHMEDGEDLYWPVNYLAKKCDPQALQELSKGRYRNQGCMQYETSIKLFGKCKYRPAIPYLVDAAVHDFCGNITDSAGWSLHAMYTESPKDFDKLEDMQKYFCGRAKQEGFDVTCNPN
jgi:hypothetical protein